MKISPQTIIKILRLYKVAEESSSAKELRNLSIDSPGDYIKADFVYKRQKYVLVLGSSVTVEDIDFFWIDKPNTAKLLHAENQELNQPLFFKGKNLLLYQVPAETMRLDIALVKNFDPNISRSQWQKYIKLGAVTVNDQVIESPKHEVLESDLLQVNFPESNPEDHQLPLIYEDEDVIVVNKPVGMLTHAKGGVVKENTVADHFKSVTTYGLDSDRPGVVHRLDRDTSGLIIGAKNKTAAKHLQDQFANRKVDKTYIAVLAGVPKNQTAKIDLPIARNPKKPSQFKVDARGKSAETDYRIIGTNQQKSLAELRPKTGRTHQLRVHMAYIGTPIEGDRVYGKSSDRLMLHAHRLTLRLPSGKSATFEAPIPAEFTKYFTDIDL